MWQQFIQKLDGVAAMGAVFQALFFARFMVQWIASERSGRSIIRLSFWYLSIVGSLGWLCYSILRVDPIFILGNSLNSVVYVRNLMLIYKERGARDAGGTPSSP